MRKAEKLAKELTFGRQFSHFYWKYRIEYRQNLSRISGIEFPKKYVDICRYSRPRYSRLPCLVLAHLLEFDNGTQNPWCPPVSHEVEKYFVYSLWYFISIIPVAATQICAFKINHVNC